MTDSTTLDHLAAAVNRALVYGDAELRTRAMLALATQARIDRVQA